MVFDYKLALKRNSFFELFEKGIEFVFMDSFVSNKFFRKYYPYLAEKLYMRAKDYDIKRFEVSIDPFKYMWVDPDQIKRFTGREKRSDRTDWDMKGSVKSGEWDKGLDDFESSDVFKSLRSRFEVGKSWEETEIYRKHVERLEKGSTTWGRVQVSNLEDLKSRCEELDELYESMKQEGYRKDKRYVRRLRDDIRIDIGRNGDLLFFDGRHRLTIAKILGLEKIPVLVIVRHEEWMKKVEEAYLSGDYLDHPEFDEFREAS